MQQGWTEWTGWAHFLLHPPEKDFKDFQHNTAAIFSLVINFNYINVSMKYSLLSFLAVEAPAEFSSWEGCVQSW